MDFGLIFLVSGFILWVSELILAVSGRADGRTRPPAGERVGGRADERTPTPTPTTVPSTGRSRKVARFSILLFFIAVPSGVFLFFMILLFFIDQTLRFLAGLWLTQNLHFYKQICIFPFPLTIFLFFMILLFFIARTIVFHWSSSGVKQLFFLFFNLSIFRERPVVNNIQRSILVQGAFHADGDMTSIVRLHI